MARPKKCRNIGEKPKCYQFIPYQTPSTGYIKLALDEFEAIKLADIKHLPMRIAAKMMGISSPTFHRILKSAHQKLAQALIQVKSIHICKCTKHQVK